MRRRQAAFQVLLKKGLRTVLGPLLPYVRSLRTLPVRKRAEQSASHLNPTRGLSVCYLTHHFPDRPPLRTEISHGGAVKLTFLAESFPHQFPNASLLYSVSSLDHPGKTEIVQMAKKLGVKIVINQNGVAYPGWYGPGWKISNMKQRETYDLADFIIYQSKFCKTSAELYLGIKDTPSAVVYNPVDVDYFCPSQNHSYRTAPILLLGGNQFSFYRFEIAAQTLRHVLTYLPGARLIVTGKLWGENQSIAKEQALSLAKKLDIQTSVEFTGQYSQEGALAIFQKADILIHTQFQDASPGLIGEAMSCGLPVVYSASGGSPELVSFDAGIGIPVEPSWDKINFPNPQEMAKATLQIWEDYTRYREAARQCALEKLRLEIYIQKHREVFDCLLG
jgi:glycosyltransferase involved in cell wall biosynthesis